MTFATFTRATLRSTLGATVLLALAGCVTVSSINDDVTTVDGETFAQVSQASGTFDDRLNAFRLENGRTAISRDPQLDAAARMHAVDMDQKGYLSHRSPNGDIMSDRMRAQGYRACKSVENIADQFPTEAAVFEAWLTSPGHRSGILERRVTDYGLAKSGDKWVYVAARRC